MTKRKPGPKPKHEPREYQYERIAVYATEHKVLDEMVKIKCKAAVKVGDKVFIQDNAECMHRHRFRINCGFCVIVDPEEIYMLIENLRGYDPYRFKPGDHIADLLILQAVP